MSKLSDVMGEEFAEEYQEKRDAARREARRVEKPTLMEACYHAVHGDGFEGEDPRFTFEGNEVDHDVLLMESPDSNIQKFKNEFPNGGMSLGMFHMNELFSCAFNEDMLDVLDNIEEDEYYVVVGRYEEKRDVDSNGEEEVYYNINPVRGIVPLEVAKQYADKFDQNMDGKSVEEQAQEQNSGSSSGSSDSDSVDISGGTEAVTDADRSDIIEVFQAVGSKQKEILEETAAGSDEHMDILVSTVQDNTTGTAEEERVLDIFEEEVEEIDGRGEDEDEDDAVDIPDIGGSDDEDDNSSDEEADETETETETEEDDEDDDASADDWF